MSLPNSVSESAPAPFPPNYRVTLTHSHPECWPKAYVLNLATGTLVAITGEGDNQTWEMEEGDRPNGWRTISHFPRFARHDDALNWYAAALSTGEAREAGMVAA
jgi:hypothetical protein